MRFVSSLSVLLLASASLWAQSNSTDSGAVWVKPEGSVRCPIDLTVKRQQGLVARSVKDEKEGPTGQGLQLNFNVPAALKVLKVTVVVHGPPETAHAIPAKDDSGDNTAIPETFHLERQAGTSSLQNSEIWTHLGAVQWIEVTEIQYADGTSWRESKGSVCRAAPGLLLLTNAEASGGPVAK
jgi:hypothetical protein